MGLSPRSARPCPLQGLSRVSGAQRLHLSQPVLGGRVGGEDQAHRRLHHVLQVSAAPVYNNFGGVVQQRVLVVLSRLYCLLGSQYSVLVGWYNTRFWWGRGITLGSGGVVQQRILVGWYIQCWVLVGWYNSRSWGGGGIQQPGCSHGGWMGNMVCRFLAVLFE